MNRDNIKKCLVYVGAILFALQFSLFTSSCSEENDEPGEWDNWQERNEAVISQWAAQSGYTRIKTYAKDASTEGTGSDYIYVEKLETGAGTESPMFTDTVRVAYRGRYIPTATYTEGYVFDQSYVGDFDWQTVSVTSGVASSYVEGFTTALMNMHVGDRWRIRIPYVLGYGNPSTSTGIRDASDLVFDIALVDFWHPGETRPTFRARQK